MNFATLWEREVGDNIRGVSFLRDQEGVVVASERVARMFDYDGEMQWRYSLGSDFRGIASLSDGGCVIAVKDGLVLLDSEGERRKETSLNKEPRAISTNNKIGLLAGSELMMLDPGGDSMVRAVLDFEPELLAHNDQGFILANRDSIESLEPKGSSRWREQVDYPIASIAAHGQDVYVVTGKEVKKLDKNGEEVWNKDLGDEIRQIDVGKYLLALLGNEAILLNTETSDPVWNLNGEFTLGSIDKEELALARERTIIFMRDVGEEEVFYEVMCRSKEKCGTFVSTKFLRRCPKCGAERIILRIVRKKLGESEKDIQN
ncbi:MAG: hypothetical protein E3J35_11205 [Methanomassiliicoccales archaeon]|nr:MAG: hypothetical protein E3J35_11205 [Methanomassiliicoccales archaeon]